MHDGVPVMMSPERVLHAETKGEAYVALREAASARRVAMSTYIRDGVAIRIERRGDLRAGCVRRLWSAAPDDALEIDDPIIVVEVLSPSTAAIDHGRKLSGYFSLPSVEHYLILDPERRVVIHHKRGAGRRDRDAGAVEGVAAARSARLRGCGRGAVPRPLTIPAARI